MPSSVGDLTTQANKSSCCSQILQVLASLLQDPRCIQTKRWKPLHTRRQLDVSTVILCNQPGPLRATQAPSHSEV